MKVEIEFYHGTTLVGEPTWIVVVPFKYKGVKSLFGNGDPVEVNTKLYVEMANRRKHPNLGILLNIILKESRTMTTKVPYRFKQYYTYSFSRWLDNRTILRLAFLIGKFNMSLTREIPVPRKYRYKSDLKEEPFEKLLLFSKPLL